ncbi:hypothetical protein M409DRAFT_49096 [Zasmidium cellare ATCC 36951]|uniref:SH3 domain-containing protein n=1 Tax=Zasmidium cellare ATCC 36951 TaxID=1080233 RepID=A0A6A6D4B0_ZASCE|nr:uncharacterized protein M409DRAFT_49096 [Zasmidium cellare ATCC 36951]KAF2174237.1 hypothetical protein M409DRAFT_49096 [Zasmidium cellare ATCC 36951]
MEMPGINDSTAPDNTRVTGHCLAVLEERADEYCPGGDLSQFESGGGERLSTRECALVLHQVAQALLYLHHDIGKYQNKLEVARAPFATSGEWHPVLHRDINLRTEQHRLMSPRRTTIKSDIWALGETFQRLCDLGPIEDAGKVSTKTSLEVCLAHLVRKCLNSHDELRPSSALIVEELDAHLYSIAPESDGMLSSVITSILTEDAKTKSRVNASKLEADLLLCARLLESGLEPVGLALQAGLQAGQDSIITETGIRGRLRVEALLRKHAPEAVHAFEVSPGDISFRPVARNPTLQIPEKLERLERKQDGTVVQTKEPKATGTSEKMKTLGKRFTLRLGARSDVLVSKRNEATPSGGSAVSLPIIRRVGSMESLETNVEAIPQLYPPPPVAQPDPPKLTKQEPPPEEKKESAEAEDRSEQLLSIKDYYSQDNIKRDDLGSVLWPYHPRAQDEFELNRGDMIKALSIWDDGWGIGIRVDLRARDWKPSWESPRSLMNQQSRHFHLSAVSRRAQRGGTVNLLQHKPMQLRDLFFLPLFGTCFSLLSESRVVTATGFVLPP